MCCSFCRITTFHTHAREAQSAGLSPLLRGCVEFSAEKALKLPYGNSTLAGHILARIVRRAGESGPVAHKVEPTAHFLNTLRGGSFYQLIDISYSQRFLGLAAHQFGLWVFDRLYPDVLITPESSTREG
jgi:hypothetical protein